MLYLARDTLSRCDRKWRGSRWPAATIKIHHNVGGLPAEFGFELIEPLRDLFKDEVRRIGLELGCRKTASGGIRSLALAWRFAAWEKLRKSGVDVLRQADVIFLGEIRRRGLDRQRRPGVRRAAPGPNRGRDG